MISVRFLGIFHSSQDCILVSGLPVELQRDFADIRWASYRPKYSRYFQSLSTPPGGTSPSGFPSANGLVDGSVCSSFKFYLSELGDLLIMTRGCLQETEVFYPSGWSSAVDKSSAWVQYVKAFGQNIPTCLPAAGLPACTDIPITLTTQTWMEKRRETERGREREGGETCALRVLTPTTSKAVGF